MPGGGGAGRAGARDAGPLVALRSHEEDVHGAVNPWILHWNMALQGLQFSEDRTVKKCTV